MNRSIQLLYNSKQMMDARPKSQPAALARSADMFPPFPSFPANAPNLEALLDATHIEPISGVEWRCGRRWHQTPRRLQDAMWYWIEAGYVQARLHDDHELIALSPGDLLLIPQGRLHEVWPAKNRAVRVHTVHFLAHLHGAMDLLSVLGMEGRFSSGRRTMFADASRRLAREHALRAPGWSWAMSNAIRDVLLEVIRHHGRRLKPSATKDQTLLHRLRPVLEHVDERLGDANLKVADLAGAIHVSEVYLRTLFRRAKLGSPVAFLHRRRMAAACLLLRTTDLSIKAVAARCGYNDTPFFYRVFGKHTGQTPLAYRRAEDV
jgi:AraC-like DNA-binding protein